jgi:endonuclease/exonuclease/phosphatase family metal-dependent hydrolase
MHWIEADRRLDYIFVTPCTRQGVGRLLQCRIVCSEPNERGIYCSDHFGVLAEVEVTPSS